VLEIECSYDPKTKSGSGFNERKPNGTIHFVEASTAVKARFNLFDSLLVDDDSDRPLLERLNPFSWEIKEGFIEPELKKAEQGERFQFIRNGYYFVDYDSTPTMPIFNRIVELKSSFK
jgi:glutaminyl-tRNA synthetase